MKYLVLYLTFFLLGGCAVVKPYERERLVDPIMAMPTGTSDEVGTDTALSKTSEHCTSRGASSVSGACPGCGS